MRVKLLSIAIMALALSLSAAPPPKSACELLTKKDLAGVQGETFAETKLTKATEGALSVSQCFYRLPTFANSISVTLMRDPNGSAGASRAWWDARFAKSDEEAEPNPHAERRARDDEDESGHGAVRIEGIGDKALWSGNRLMGELDVLDHSNIVRISVGGAGDVEEKIAKAKRLAAVILVRLHQVRE
jgi:hypothetical protein